MANTSDQYVPQCVDQGESLRTAYKIWIAASVVVLLWMGLIIAAPLAQASGHTTIASAIYIAFGPLCHQISERSFHLEGHAFAVCARCTGIYAGFALGILLYPLVRSLRRTDSPPRYLLLLASLPTAIDWFLGFANIWENTHFSRVTTGAILGGVCALFVVPGLVDVARMDWRNYFSKRSTDTPLAREIVRPMTNDGVAPSDYGSPSSRI